MKGGADHSIASQHLESHDPNESSEDLMGRSMVWSGAANVIWGDGPRWRIDVRRRSR